MSDYPRNRYEMKRAHYTMLRATTCSACGVAVEDWKTRAGNFFRCNAATKPGDDRERTQWHRGVCPGPSATPSASVPPQTDRQRHISRLAATTKARIVVALYDDETFHAHVAPGIKPEDVRHELITVANKLRNQMEAKR